jgi:hypothetical protein
MYRACCCSAACSGDRSAPATGGQPTRRRNRRGGGRGLLLLLRGASAGVLCCLLPAGLRRYCCWRGRGGIYLHGARLCGLASIVVGCLCIRLRLHCHCRLCLLLHRGVSCGALCCRLRCLHMCCYRCNHGGRLLLRRAEECCGVKGRRGSCHGSAGAACCHQFVKSLVEVPHETLVLLPGEPARC